MQLLSLKQQKNLIGGAAWIVGSLILITFFDIIKISLDSYHIGQEARVQKNVFQEQKPKNIELRIVGNNEILYV